MVNHKILKGGFYATRRTHLCFRRAVHAYGGLRRTVNTRQGQQRALTLLHLCVCWREGEHRHELGRVRIEPSGGRRGEGAVVEIGQRRRLLEGRLALRFRHLGPLQRFFDGSHEVHTAD